MIKAGRRRVIPRPIKRKLSPVRNAAYAVTFAREGSAGEIAISKRKTRRSSPSFTNCETCGTVASWAQTRVRYNASLVSTGEIPRETDVGTTPKLHSDPQGMREARSRGPGDLPAGWATGARIASTEIPSHDLIDSDLLHFWA
jgi:hypothetical protein